MVVAVGEIGLDYFRNLSPPDVQRAAFDRQLALAASLGKPVLVHDRDAHDDVRAALLGQTGRGVLHAFSGDAAMALEMTAAGFLVSFALPVTFSSAAGPRAAAAAIPAGASWSRPIRRGWRRAAPEHGTSRPPLCAWRSSSPVCGACRPSEIASQVADAFDRLLGG